MPEDFVVARNPEPDSKLPYLLRVPLGRDGIILKSRETWPRTSKVYCHRIEEWPEDPDVVERVPTRSCVRRGASIDLVLDRARENRSQLVFTRIRGGRAAIFWQTARTNKQARPAVTVPSARAAGIVELEVVVDSHERYPYTFKDQQVVTRRAPLAAGDYAVELGGALLASVERKTLEDLVSSLTSGKLKYQLSDLAAVPRAALVVEDRYSQVFRSAHVRPAVVADGLAECQLTWPGVPIMFLETRALAQEWTYRFLAAARAAAELEYGGEVAVRELAPARPLEPAAPTPAEVRAWALSEGLEVSERGRLKREIVDAFAVAGRPWMAAGVGRGRLVHQVAEVRLLGVVGHGGQDRAGRDADVGGAPGVPAQEAAGDRSRRLGGGQVGVLDRRLGHGHGHRGVVVHSPGAPSINPPPRISARSSGPGGAPSS